MQEMLQQKEREVTPSYARIDGEERVSGRAKYTGDFKVAQMLYGRIIASSIPHGLVKKIDLNRALSIDGVEAIITCLDDTTLWANGEREHQRRVFTNRVRFIGDCIGAVAARTRNIAQDAIESISVDYENLPTSFTIEDSLGAGAPKIWENANTVGPLKYGFGDIEDAFRKSDYVFEADYSTSRVHNCPLEPAVSLAMWDNQNEKLTVYAATQSIFGCREGLSEDLGVPEEKIRIISLYKGGGFGNKSNSMNYDVVASLLARKASRPVILEYSRADDFNSVHGRWSSKQHLRAAVNRSERKLLAVDLKAYCDIGAYTRHVKHGKFVNGAESYYSCEAWNAEVYGVYTNTPATAHMRAPTGPIANFAAETMVDEIANELGQDPLDFRIRNAVVKYQNHKEYTNNSMKECLIEGARQFDWREKWRPAASRKGTSGRSNENNDPIKRGVGVAMGTWHARVGAGEALVRLKKDGSLEVYVGVVDIGTGAKSTMAVIASKTLGISVSEVKIIYGDTDTCPYSIGESGSRTTNFTGTAVRDASLKVKEKILELAARRFSKKKEELVINNGRIFVARSMNNELATVKELIEQSGSEITEKSVTDQKLPEDKERESFTAHFAQVALDIETGEISIECYVASQECGEIVNELTATSQIQGGVVMGIGMALSEKLLIDPNYGGLLNPSLMNYRLPNHSIIPKIEVLFVKKEGSDSLGPKSLGEVPIVPVPAVIGNAIFNATGVRLRSLPFTQESFVRAFDPSL